MNVLVSGRSIRLTAKKLIGQGGEAEVFRHGRDQVVKVFKLPDHPDFAADPALADAARSRLAEHQQKLADFPSGLPRAVIAPIELARQPSGRVIGYTMRRIRDADSLYALGRASARRSRGLDAQRDVLLGIHDALSGLHARGVVVGDLNDLNVLVKERTAHLIDADSFQFGSYRCPVYSERFLDPLVTNAAAAGKPLPFTPDSDWFAFAVMVVQTLLSVGPYGGIHTPAGSCIRVPSARRQAERLSIFNSPVRLPRPALPPAVLSQDLAAFLEEAFALDRRGVFPRKLLAELRFDTCKACGLEHARTACPHCLPSVAVARRPSAHSLAAQPITHPGRAAEVRALAESPSDVFIDAGHLYRQGALGRQRIGDVLSGATRMWVGESFGLGFYCASRLRVGFVFDRYRGGLNDQVALEPITGTLAAASCALSSDLAWLSVTEAVGPAIEQRLTAVSRTGQIVGRASVGEEPWAPGLAGACAVGSVLLVPTDEGVVRLEIGKGGGVSIGKVFHATRAVVDSATQLVTSGRELFAIAGANVFQLSV